MKAEIKNRWLTLDQIGEEMGETLFNLRRRVFSEGWTRIDDQRGGGESLFLWPREVQYDVRAVDAVFLSRRKARVAAIIKKQAEIAARGAK